MPDAGRLGARNSISKIWKQGELIFSNKLILLIGFIPMVCRALRLESVDFIGQRRGFACQVTEDNHQKKMEFWMFMQPSQHFGSALFRRLKHSHPRTEAAGRRAWMKLCWK